MQLIPGSGEPNFDSFEVNPYASKKQKQEAEIQRLLDKLQPEMITLNPNLVGTIDTAPQKILRDEEKLELDHGLASTNDKKLLKTLKRKQADFLDREMRQKKLATMRAAIEKQNTLAAAKKKPMASVLDRFSTRVV